MITCYLMGGIGNQLFQIFTVIAAGIQNGKPFLFPDLKELGGANTTIRKTYWDTLFSNIIVIPPDKFPEQMCLIKEKDYRYNELPIRYARDNHILLYGYFQSYKYFSAEYKTIYKQLKFDDKKKELTEKLNFIDFENTICLHFRIGDYKLVSDYHPLLDLQYYLDSLSYISEIYPSKKFTVYYCCEDTDLADVLISINLLKDTFNTFTFIRCTNDLHDWEQLLFMSLCQHNIIANSSFSWWGAFLNNYENKIVCYPSLWFGPKAPHDTTDLIPSGWKCIQATYTPFNAPDL